MESLSTAPFHELDSAELLENEHVLFRKSDIEVFRDEKIVSEGLGVIFVTTRYGLISLYSITAIFLFYVCYKHLNWCIISTFFKHIPEKHFAIAILFTIVMSSLMLNTFYHTGFCINAKR